MTNEAVNETLKDRLYAWLDARGADGAMLDELMDVPEFAEAGREAVQTALQELKAERKLFTTDPIFGWRVGD